MFIIWPSDKNHHRKINISTNATRPQHTPPV